MIVVGLERLQRGMRAEHAAASRAQHVPAEIEQPEPRRMQESGDRALLIEAVLRGEIEDVDAVELVILTILDEAHDRIDHLRIGGLLQNGKLGLEVAHRGGSI